MYHHYVRDPPFPVLKVVSVQEFRRQVEHARELGHSFAGGVRRVPRGQLDPRCNICFLTFDDGLREHHDTVTEILLSQGDAWRVLPPLGLR